MITVKDPRQTGLFDKFADVLPPKIRRVLDDRWEGVFRTTILELMPIEAMSQRLCVDNGRPSHELYAMCGLIMMKEYFGWTIEETIWKYSCDLSVQYALNVQSDKCEVAERTFMRYLDDFRKKELAVTLMEEVTAALIEKLNIKVDQQRLDSTHICSNMANWGRAQLMANVVKKFLIQLKRHQNTLYYKLDRELLDRYEKSTGWIFADPTTKSNGRKAQNISSNREQIGYDMLRLLETFETHPQVSNMNTYKMLFRVFHEQCYIDDGKVKIQAHPGGNAMVNPSDPDAANGHKGNGYQAQVMETCNPENPVQLITAVLPQKASACDQNAVDLMLPLAEKVGAKPETVLADAGYGSDENVLNAADAGVKLVAPTTGKNPERFGLEDFHIDELNRVVKCPCGKSPLKKQYGVFSGKGRVVFASSCCGDCPHRTKCPVSKSGNNYSLDYDARSLRLRTRRIHEGTAFFQEEYRLRGGIEGLFGRLKQFGPLRRLMVRGKTAVHNAIYLIMAGHNIMQAVRAMRKTGPETAVSVFWSLIWMKKRLSMPFMRVFRLKSCPLFS